MVRRRSRLSHAPSTHEALEYTNRMGISYYLHQGTTKTGKPRYFVAKTIREGALSAMPDGYEFSESINGVVSVRRVSTTAPKISEADQAMARTELSRYPHLQRHQVEVSKDELIVYQPEGLLSLRYDPVMKFVPIEEDEDSHYTVHRMTYRGRGGWSWPLATGSLRRLLQEYLKHVGTEEFFELL